MKIVKIPWWFGYKAVVIYPFLFHVGELDAITLNHERIHFDQIKRDGVLKFYAKYLMEYTKNRFKGMGHWDSYFSISYEVEAYSNENNLDYEV